MKTRRQLIADFRSENTRYREWYQGCKGKLELTLDEYEASGRWLAEPKRDGIWAIAFFDESGVEFYSRTQERKAYSLNALVIPELFGTALVGELGFGSQESRRRRADIGHDFMDVFDVLYVNYDPHAGMLPGDMRRAELESIDRILQRVERPIAPDGEAVRFNGVFRLVPRWTRGFAGAYQGEPEGLILKPIDEGPYVGGGEKVKHWIKVKKDHTVDMVILGYEISTAETKAGKDMVEHLVCGMYVDGKLVPLTKTGGMDHDLQRDVVENWQDYSGKVVELKHFGQFRSGALRHPSVVRMRPDKRAEDCVFDPETISPNSFKSV